MKILVANRGEIAVRIMRACRELGLRSVAVYSECDRESPHVWYADEACYLGPSEPRESYLHVDRVMDAARRAAADAIHPGYGFLAENAAFARACRDTGLIFIGPSADVIELMGAKTAARRAAIEAGVPVVPGTCVPLDQDVSDAELERSAAPVGFPLLVKADAGGGGKGMRRVSDSRDLVAAVRVARRESHSAFGDPAIYFERLLERPRHVEIQLLADQHNTICAFVERECSIQRRHQKMVEESPSRAVSQRVREGLVEAAITLAKRVGYTGAGTIEFLLDQAGHFYFLEMNTRLQVEHPVTEMTTGVDLVQWQIRVARGEPLTLDPERLLRPHGHAIECRIYAEDPDAGFLPSPGRISALHVPAGPGVRDDGGVAEGFEVPVYYDAMISKLVTWADTRAQAIARMQRALAEYDVRGIRTTIPFFRWLLDQPAFVDGGFDTTFVDRVLAARQGQSFEEAEPDAEEVAVLAAALYEHGRAGRSEGSQGSTWLRAARLEALRD